MSTFEEVGIKYEMIDGVCYLNGEDMVSHLKGVVYRAVEQAVELVSQGQMDRLTYVVAESSILGMSGVGMWIEECVISATAEKFREALDKEWPSL